MITVPTQANGPFRGRFEIKLDAKGRMLLPASFRHSLPLELPQLVITNSRYRNHSCLHAYSIAEWEKLERRIAKLSSLKTDVEAFRRFYLSGGQAVEVDGQNRILVPQSLRRFAELDSSIVLVGLGEKFEIWSQSSWTTIYRDLTESFEETLNAVAGIETGDDE